MESIMTGDGTLPLPTIWHGPKWGKRTTPRRGRQRTRFGASGTLTGAMAPLSGTFLPKRVLCRSQLAAIYESMTSLQCNNFALQHSPLWSFMIPILSKAKQKLVAHGRRNQIGKSADYD